MYLATNSFIADISSEKYRAFRYGMLHLAGSLARPIAPIIGAYLLSFGTEEWGLKYGYVLVFSTSLASTALGAILLFWRIRSYKWVPEKKEVKIMRIIIIIHNIHVLRIITLIRIDDIEITLFYNLRFQKVLSVFNILLNVSKQHLRKGRVQIENTF